MTASNAYDFIHIKYTTVLPCRHLHEIQSGRTSSISHEILGFDSEGNPIDYTKCNTAEEICENSTKLITVLETKFEKEIIRLS